MNIGCNGGSPTHACLIKPFITVFLWGVFGMAGLAQPTLSPTGARAAGMGGITSVDVDVWSAINNPGSLGMMAEAGAGVSHEQRFAMADMGISTIVGTLPLWGNGVGVYVSSLNPGLASYGESLAGLSAGRKLNEYLAVGVGIEGRMLHFPQGYQNLWAVAGQAGILARPASRLTLGFHVANLSLSKWNGEENTLLPVVFTLGACYVIASRVQVYAEATKDIYEALRVKIGTEFTVVKALYLRVGVVSAPFETHFGVGYAHKRLRFDAALSRHPVLGYTPTGSISIRFSSSSRGNA
ncbi:MAG: hypothetical protein LBS12_02910 [Prevotellaceae bacterium]|jgi:hypothetical protein|nr:hypothetical protein [Prevotellaceae bacterium]